MKLPHPALVDLLRRAYSGERAAALAYVGHARSLRDPGEKAAVRRIELDEWEHRENVLGIMRRYDISVSRWYEIKFFIIGRFISLCCYFIGWFMPYFFAGKLESGNVCEYFVMMQYFHSLGIRDHDEVLHEMGMKEKDHEDYFLERVKESPLLPLFEKVFGWGRGLSRNDVDSGDRLPPERSGEYCKHHNRPE